MVSFNIELGKENTNGETPIYIRVSQNRKMRRLRFGMNAMKGDLTALGTFKNKLLEYAVERQVQDMREKVFAAGASALSWDIEQIMDLFVEKPAPKETFSLDFIAYGYQVVDKLNAEGRGKTAKGYVTALRNFCKFLGKDSIDINEITKAMLLRYEEWFKMNNIGARAWELYMSNLQSLHNSAKRLYNDDDTGEINIKLSPFANISYKRSAAERRKVEKRAISATAIRCIYDLPSEVLLPRALMARDAFIMSFALCGMNAVDMFKHKRDPKCPADVIEFYRSKTYGRSGVDAFTRVTINPIFSPFNERLKGVRHTWFFSENYADADGFNSALSRGLRDMVAAAAEYYAEKWHVSEDEALERMELPRNLTFYAARHAWSTIAANDCKIPTETIDRCLCHVVNSIAASNYIKRDYRYVDEANAAVIDFVFGTAR